jgi:hypothetical protein
MSAETISSALPRAFDYSRSTDNAANEASDELGEVGLEQRVEATTGGQGAELQGEQSGPEQQLQRSFLGSNPIAPEAVSYPDPRPSLPEPLVPIRKVPMPDHVSESNPVRENLEKQQLGDSTNPADQLVDEASLVDVERSSQADRSRETADKSQRTGQPEPRVLDSSTAPTQESQRDRGADKTLESVVFTQGHNAPTREKTDSEYSGRIVSVTR